jgi:hypothetical protein|nr:MAG TPA: hypothetical protein [Caudoviricetes sp.]
MIKAKLFKSQVIQGKWKDAAEQFEDFINSNLIDDVIKIVEVEQSTQIKMEGTYSYVEQLLLIFREGDE